MNKSNKMSSTIKFINLHTYIHNTCIKEVLPIIVDKVFKFETFLQNK
jgi:hypothetical protein